MKKKTTAITKRIFRVLDNVPISYKKSKTECGFTYIPDSVRKAVIYPCPADLNPKLYRIHELLHVALRRLDIAPDDQKDDIEEVLIQDIIALIPE